MTIQLSKEFGIYHIGDTESRLGLDCNPYLIVDGLEAVLIDPGSIMDFESVLANVEAIVPLSQIKYVILHHEDPDFCSAVPHLEKRGLNAQIITSWRTMTLIQYYDIKSPYYLIEEHDNRLILESGRILEFILTPYLHFAGAFATYDHESHSLFSSDLFGAFSYNRTLYADENYMDKMLTFHEHYMPSNSVLRPVMDVLLTYKIELILPQHGAIIRDHIPKYIKALRNLECGTLLTPIKRNFMASGGFLMLYNEIMNRYANVYLCEEVIAIFEGIPSLRMDTSKQIVDYDGDGAALWAQIFETVKAKKGMLWLTVIEPFVKTLSATYDVALPPVFVSLLETANQENQRLHAINLALDQSMKAVEEKMNKCPITGLYNETFLKSLLLNELEEEDWRSMGALVFISIDNYSKIKFRYGEDEENHILLNLSYLLKEHFNESAIFKMQSCDFGVYVKGIADEALVDMTESFRHAVEQSEFFITEITISVGVSFSKEIALDAITFEKTLEDYMELAIHRLRQSKLLGKNRITYSGIQSSEMIEVASILIVDTEEVNLSVLKSFFNNLGILVFTATDGLEGFKLATEHFPNLIISETQLPKIDGFLLRENLLKRSETKSIEMIYLSQQKNEDSVRRALELGVTHYIKKPYMLSELVGIASRKLKGLIE